VLLGELAPQHQHGAQVLERHREAHLADQRRAALGRLQRGAGDEAHPGEHERHGEHRAEQPERVEVEHPRRQAADERGRRGRGLAHQVAHGPGHQPATDERRRPGGQAGARREQRPAVAERDHHHTERRPDQDPLERVAGQPTDGELAGGGPHRGTDGDQEAELAPRRATQRDPAVDRGEQHVAHVGALQGERPAPAPGPQPEEQGDGHDEAHRRRAMVDHVVERRPGDLAVADRSRDQDDRRDRDQTGDVHLVERIDPVDLGHALGAASLAQRADDGMGFGNGHRHVWRRYRRCAPETASGRPQARAATCGRMGPCSPTSTTWASPCPTSTKPSRSTPRSSTSAPCTKRSTRSRASARRCSPSATPAAASSCSPRCAPTRRSASSSTASPARASSRWPTGSKTSTPCRHAARARRPPALRQPKGGTAGSRVNFIHPKDAGGVLVELVQPGPS
jgi:hypothetical protein